MTLTFELGLDRVKTKQPAKYLRQRSFTSKVIARTHRHTNRHPEWTDCLTRSTKWTGVTTCQPSRPHLLLIYTSGDVNPLRYGIVPAAAAAVAVAAAAVAERNRSLISTCTAPRCAWWHTTCTRHAPAYLSLCLPHSVFLSICLSALMHSWQWLSGSIGQWPIDPLTHDPLIDD